MKLAVSSLLVGSAAAFSLDMKAGEDLDPVVFGGIFEIPGWVRVKEISQGTV